jgi:hypothetical protein
MHDLLYVKNQRADDATIERRGPNNIFTPLDGGLQQTGKGGGSLGMETNSNA